MLVGDVGSRTTGEEAQGIQRLGLTLSEVPWVGLIAASGVLHFWAPITIYSRPALEGLAVMNSRSRLYGLGGPVNSWIGALLQRMRPPL